MMTSCPGSFSEGGGLSPQKLRKDIKVEKYPDRKTINPPNIIFTPARSTCIIDGIAAKLPKVTCLSILDYMPHEIQY